MTNKKKERIPPFEEMLVNYKEALKQAADPGNKERLEKVIAELEEALSERDKRMKEFKEGFSKLLNIHIEDYFIHRNSIEELFEEFMPQVVDFIMQELKDAGYKYVWKKEHEAYNNVKYKPFGLW